MRGGFRRVAETDRFGSLRWTQRPRAEGYLVCGTASGEGSRGERHS